MIDFTVTVDHEVSPGVEVRMVVSGQHTPPVAISRRGHPDTWAPAEDGALAIVDVRNTRGAAMPGDIVKRLRGDEGFVGKVEAELWGYV